MAKIIHKKSSVAGKIPAINDLEFGELALNYADGKLFYKDSNNAVQSFSGAALSNSTRQQFTATANQTTFNITYTPGQVDVYLNGIKLLVGIDFTATNGSNIILTTGADAGDIVDIVAGTIFASADWQYVTNKPTTISGFGITDAQPLDADLTAISAVSGNTGFLRKIAADTWQLDTNTYLTGNQNIVFSGDVSGNGTTNISLTLANSGVTAGLYGSTTNIPQITVDAKGRVTNVTNVAVSIPSGSLTFTGDVTGTGSTGSSTALTLANSGVTAGTYTKVTVDSKGRATSGTTLSASDIPSLDASKITSGTIDAARLPSYVDDVLEYANLASFPGTGETGKIYVAIDSNKTYRWSGSTYIEISANVGTVTSVSGTGTVSGLTLTGTVTTSGSLTLGGAITGFLPSSGGTLTGAVTSSGTFTSTDNANVNGSNFVVDTINKSLALYAYDVRRSGSTVGGITVGGVGVFASGTTIGGSLAIHAGNYSSYALPLSGGTLTGLVTFDGGSTASAGPVITSSSSSGPRLSIHSTGPGGKNLWLISNSTDNADGAGKLQLWNSTDGYTGLTFATTSSMAHMLYGAYTQMSGSARAPIFYDTNDTGYYIDAASTSVLNSTVMYGHLSNYQPIGASDDVRTGIRMYDTTAMAAGIGGQIVLGYKYTSGGDYTEGAIIKMFKLNGTSGDYSSGLKIQVRDTGEPLATQVVVDPSGNLYSYQSVRAPIFYDNDNTGYYVNPASTSRVSAIDFGSSGYYIHAGDWGMRNTTPYGWIQFGPANSSWAHIYASHSIYFNQNTYVNGNWMLYEDTWQNNKYFGSDGIIRSGVDMRAPLYYDSADTSYYVDPNSGSRLAHLYVGNVSSSNDGGWNARLNIVGSSHARLDVVSNSDGIITTMYSHTGQGVGRVGTYSNHPLILMAQGGAVGGYVYSGSLRSPIFYDQDDTTYYIDPANDVAVRVYGEICNSNYQAGAMQPGALNIGRTDLNYSWSGTTWSSDVRAGILANCTDLWEFVIHDSGQRVVSPFLFDGGGNHRLLMGRDIGWGTMPIEASNSFRAPIFYDSNDTNYYLDPNDTSRLSYLRPNRISIVGSQDNGAPRWDFKAYVVESQHHYGQTSTQTMYIGEDNYIYVRSIGEASGSFRAPIFYDSNDTNYYLDPRSASRLSGLRLDGVDNQASGSDYILWINKPNNNDWAFGITGQLEYNIIYDGASSHSYGVRGLAAGAEYWRVGTDLLYHNSNIRAPIFYDNSDTGYYLDPNGNSLVSGLRVNKSWGGGPVGPEQFTITGNYPSMTFRNSSTDNKWLLHHDGSNIQFYYGGTWNNDAWSRYAQISTVDIHHVSSLRAPIFYDYNDTGYYLDPTSTTSLRTVGDWRADSATWTGEFAGKMQYHSSNWYLQFSSNLLFRNSGGTNVLTCDSSGNLTANGNVTAYSDIRLKENIYTIDGALSKVLNLRGVYYNKIGETKRKIGLVAQEAQQVIPEVVISVETVDPATGNASELLAVDYGNTVALLIEAVKEQQARIVQQAARIEKLEKLLEKLI